MKVQMLDTVETPCTVIPSLGDSLEVPQEGMNVISMVDKPFDGETGYHFVLHLRKGAAIEVPERLGKRLGKLGLAQNVDA